MKVRPLGDTAFVIELEDKPASILRVSRLASILQRDPPPGVVEAQAAFSGLTVFYDPVAVLDWKGLAAAIAGAFPASDPGPGRPVIEIPVDYGGEHGPDLESVARHARLSPAEAIAAHSAIEYTAAAVGFVPGFAYLEGLPPALHAPRRATPRTQVPAGSVGIGGRYTGIYPFAVPGGWNLIGRTGLSLFDASRSEPALIRPGDRVRFIQSAMSRNT